MNLNNTNNKPKRAMLDVIKDNKTNKNNPLNKKIADINQWLKDHKKITLVGLVVFILLILIISFFLMSKNNNNSEKIIEGKYTKKVVEKKPKEYFSQLSGLKLPDEAATKKHIVCSIIENSIDARPQSGLKKAGMVFEAQAEGGITRFLSIWQNEEPRLIGPIRSVRQYYIDWAAGYNCGLAHVGGSPDGLEMIRSGKYAVDLDQFFNSGFFWRSSDRYAPHNVYSDLGKLTELSKNKGVKEPNIKPLTRTDSTQILNTDVKVTKFSTNVSFGAYNSEFTYNPETRTYLRTQNGVPHNDREEGQIAPSAVLVINADTRYQSDGHHLNINTLSSGKRAWLFQNGIVLNVKWRRNNVKDALEIIDDSGKPVQVVRGQLWITAIASDKVPTW